MAVKKLKVSDPNCYGDEGKKDASNSFNHLIVTRLKQQLSENQELNLKKKNQFLKMRTFIMSLKFDTKIIIDTLNNDNLNKSKQLLQVYVSIFFLSTINMRYFSLSQYQN